MQDTIYFFWEEGGSFLFETLQAVLGVKLVAFDAERKSRERREKNLHLNCVLFSVFE